MTKSTKPAKNVVAEAATRLLPTVVTNNNEIGAAAFEGPRKRPILAINDDGDLVVCCRATARVHGWEVQGSLHVRPTAATAPSKKTNSTPQRRADDGQHRRATDKAGAVVLPAAAVAELKSTISAAAASLGMDDLLATK